MVAEISDKGKKLFKCSECGFIYANKEIANKCEDFCTKHGACSLEITKQAIKV